MNNTLPIPRGTEFQAWNSDYGYVRNMVMYVQLGRYRYCRGMRGACQGFQPHLAQDALVRTFWRFLGAA